MAVVEKSSSCPSSSKWLSIPRNLHRLATLTLIVLTVVHLHTRTRSPILAGVFLTMAATGIIMDKSSPHSPSSQSPSSQTSSQTPSCMNALSKANLGLSLFRATLYAFIGDAAAAQLLWTPTNEADKFDFHGDEWTQLGIAVLMWSIGALIWIIEPIIFFVLRRRVKRSSASCFNNESSRLEGGYDRLPLVDSDDEEEEEEEEELDQVETTIIWEAEDFELPIHAEKF